MHWLLSVYFAPPSPLRQSTAPPSPLIPPTNFLQTQKKAAIHQKPTSAEAKIHWHLCHINFLDFHFEIKLINKHLVYRTTQNKGLEPD